MSRDAGPSQPRRAAASAFVGSAVEYYDFTLFATASALFLGPVFFAPLGPTGATLAALATFGVAFLARPAGALLFGHLGDRRGRRHSLVRSLVLMGAATFAIGALPGHAAWGTASPILLVALRLLQGLSAGGEQAGSNALALEHAPDGQRARYAAWTMQGTSLGTLAGKVAFLAMVALPRPELLAWGWRVPFLLAGPLMLVAWFIRRGVAEPPVFRAGRPPRAPVADVVTGHGRTVALVAAASLAALGGAALNVFGLSYATQVAGMEASAYLSVLVAVTAGSMLVQPVWARLADRVGRRPVFAASTAATAVAVFGFLAAAASGHVAWLALGASVYTLVWSAANAVGASLFAEQFPTRVRYTGTALGTQLGMVVVGFSPTIMASLAGPGPGGWVPAAAFAAACLAVSSAAAWAVPETGGRALA